jgi:hypothetical protein
MFSFQVYGATSGLPTNPKIEKIRTDVTWHDVLRNAHMPPKPEPTGLFEDGEKGGEKGEGKERRERRRERIRELFFDILNFFTFSYFYFYYFVKIIYFLK